MRLFTSVLASVAMIFVASAASASVTFTATATSARPLNLLEVGDQVTIDIRISSTGTPRVAGVGAAVFGYDGNVLDFVSGNAVASFLHEICIPAAGCFNGLDSQVSGALSEGNNAGAPYVQIANAVSTTPRNGTGALDPGLNGVVGGGDAQFRVTFVAAAAGLTTLQIGTNILDAVLGNAIIVEGGGAEDAINAAIVVNVIPEPGTALLMGLGLAGLAAAGRRE